MKIKVLGPGCGNCVNLEKNTSAALKELGLVADIEKVTDYGDILSYNIMSTPGLVVDEKVILAGRVPTARQVKDLLTPLMS